jgi:hypothetical protein
VDYNKYVLSRSLNASISRDPLSAGAISPIIIISWESGYPVNIYSDLLVNHSGLTVPISENN